MSLVLDNFAVLAAIVLLGALWGLGVAVADLNALYLCVSLVGCAFVLYDFRAGVVMLILLMPLSGSQLFPHAMFGITGLNPLNLLLAGTLGSYLLQALADGSLRRFIPRPLLWFYVVPILVAGVIGTRHLGEIPAAIFVVYQHLDFRDAAGYLRDMVAKPLLMVVYALLLGAAAAKSERPEKFLIPAVVSIWVMGAIVVAFVLQSGITLDELASSTSREFLSPLGLHANDLGRLFAVAYALLLFTWTEAETPGLKLALLASMGLAVGALMLTFSRGAFLGFAVANAAFILWRFNARTLAAACLVLVAGALLLPEAVYERLAAGRGEGLDAISAGRVNEIWLPLLPEVLRHPVFGNGIGSILWSDAMRRGAGEMISAVTHPHSAYLEAVLDMGVAGTLLLCAYFAHVWAGFRRFAADPAVSRALRGFYLGGAAGLLTMLVTNLTDSSFVPRPEHAFLWLAIGMMYGQQAKASARTVAARAESGSGQ
ncbi:MAG TPA: O-antigen ligase family protein [Burkholderiales bacterium]|nr:O-antigen ligase family protein [Burkholderiales bacterium]